MSMSTIRRGGGGRKSALESIEGLDAAFLKVLSQHTAGSPLDETVKWTNPNRHEIADLLKADGVDIRIYKELGNPVISMDTKKELIGSLYRAGRLYTQEEVKVYDHDWPSLAEGVVIPHGLYDLARNEGYIQIGTSHDTGEFACDSLQYLWQHHGVIHYPDAVSILLLCDGGGSNSSRHYLFKQDLQRLANELGIEIRIAHYPPYTSKYNPIEHRLFPHVTRACQGVIFKSTEIVQELIAKTKTSTGLQVFATILDGVYETGRNVTEEYKQNMEIVFDDYLSQWNYTAVPQIF